MAQRGQRTDAAYPTLNVDDASRSPRLDNRIGGFHPHGSLHCGGFATLIENMLLKAPTDFFEDPITMSKAEPPPRWQGHRLAYRKYGSSAAFLS
jgi:hypothetical protein